jgi:hypothetical protein
LKEFIEGHDVVKFVKALRARWRGQVEERPRTKWLDSVVMGAESGKEERVTEQAEEKLWRKPKPTKGCSADDDDDKGELVFSVI